MIEDFNYATNGTMSSGPDNGGSGWSAAWGGGAGVTGTMYTSNSANLSYSGGGYNITQTGTGYAYGTYNAYRGINRTFSALTGTIWFSVLLQDNASVDHAGIEFNNPRTSGLDYNASPYQIDLYGSSLDVYDGSTTTSTVAATGLAVGQTHLIVGSITIGSGADTLNVWADPSDLSNLGTPLYTNSSVDMGNSLSSAGIFSYVDSGTTDSQIDALMLSDGGGNSNTAFTAVTGVTPSSAPEPGRGVLLMVFLLGFVMRRRRRHLELYAPQNER